MPAKPVQKITKKKILIPLFLLSAFAFFTLGKEVAAQIPPPPYVECSGVRSPEFHSLRPYQKSPCNQEPEQTARFCGNRLVLTDTVSALQTSPPQRASNCELVSGNTYRCSYLIAGRTANYDLDLSGAVFPILGNTENVANSQNQTDEFDDAKKVNEYVSWYLSGTTGKAESGADENPDEIVNFSGPLKKLLPWSTQNEFRAEAVENAGGNRHDQIVGCVDLLGRITNCYPQRLGVREIRLSAWENNLPPDPGGYDDFQDFWVDYQRWRGNSCAQIFGFNICVNNPLKPDWPGNLYSYIPFSSTEDRVGLVSVDTQNVTEASENLEISNARLTTTPAELFFAHTEEVSGLAEKLQLTFTPEGNPTAGGVSSVSPGEACDLTNIRSNEGDDLFAASIEGNLTYDAEFSCDFPGTVVGVTCRKNVSVGLGVVTETPKADELWSRLVAGSSGIFKRIFPKIGGDSAFPALYDMPAATKVTYSGSGLVSAGNPGVRSGESAELYFPHIGSLSEYFLKGIQTILRPKGYGEQISFAPSAACTTGEVGSVPDFPSASGTCQLGGTGLPATLNNIIESAAESFKVPPSLIYGIMFGEGAFNPGRYDWTEENVQSWSRSCSVMPNCSPGTWPSQGPVPYYESNWESVKDASKVIDPSRDPNPCNLVDVVFALAKDLKGNTGASSFAGKTCFGINLKTGGANPNSCSWSNSEVETAIKVWETGGVYACLTEKDSCATGGGMSAACPEGGDNCEKINRRYPGEPSHNGCIWDQYQRYK